MKPTVMNKKRKILTVAAMVVFGVIIVLHSFGWFYNTNNYEYVWTFKPRLVSDPIIRDIRMPLFVLAVFYVGTFSLLGGERRDETKLRK